MKNGRKRRLINAFIICALSAGLGGCAIVEEAQKLVPETEPVFEETTLLVKPDGTWTEMLMEKLDQPYYDTNELKALVDETVSAFNASDSSGNVAVDSFEVGENGISLQMTYSDAHTYAEYNQVPAFDGSMLEAQMEGFLFLNDFRKVTDGATGSEVISNEEPLSHKEYRVLVTDPSHVVAMPEKVLYVSANAAVTDWKTVRPAEESEEEPEQDGLVLPSSAVYVDPALLNKAGEAELEKTYLYIIYE